MVSIFIQGTEQTYAVSDFLLKFLHLSANSTLTFASMQQAKEPLT